MRPILFNIGPVPIQSYTVLMLTAFLLVGWLSYREAKRRDRLTDDTMLVGSAALLGAVLGAKLGMLVFLGPAEFWRLLPTIPAHGATLVGGITGGYLTSVLVERALKIERCTGDLIAPFLPLGQAIGRLGDFLGADAYGTVSNVPWAVYQAGAYRHPAQLYELVLDLAFFAFLQRWRRHSFRDGEIFRVYLFGYALIRFPIEFLRYQPTPLYFLGLTLVQWLCLAAVTTFGVQLYAQRKGVKCVCDLLPRFLKRVRAPAVKEITHE
ncbi:MAG: prolipoprotein diacylglyceryl transferase [Chloroflexi bacterium]|nr:prolipoprotein diacylglyceryl transferase [Chloroflexota bacterium]